MTTYVSDFSRNDRVEFTPEARKMFVGVATGTVVGFSRNGMNVRVRHDGSKDAVSYAPHFWQPSDVPALPSGTRRCVGCKQYFPGDDVDRCVCCTRTPFCEKCMIEHPCGGRR